MQRFAFIGLSMLACQTTPSAAETITFAAENGFRFIRCTDFVGSARCEFITNQTSGILTCVAFDKQNEPIASTATVVDLGPVTFPDIDYRKIEKVICRR